MPKHTALKYVFFLVYNNIRYVVAYFNNNLRRCVRRSFTVVLTPPSNIQIFEGGVRQRQTACIYTRHVNSHALRVRHTHLDINSRSHAENHTRYLGYSVYRQQCLIRVNLCLYTIIAARACVWQAKRNKIKTYV